MFKYHKLFLLMMLFLAIVGRANTIDYFEIKHIVLENRKHVIIKENKTLHKIFIKYINKKLTLKDLQHLQKEIEDYYVSKGYEYTRVLIPPQTIKGGTLHLLLFIPMAGKIVVKGNKYYSTKFILKRFRAKENSYLKYDEMTQSILMLNDYPDLSVKMLLENNETTKKADITLQVKDKRPFHVYLQVNNLGAESTSKNKMNISGMYGNLLTDGDKLTFATTYALQRKKHNYLYMAGYDVPLNTMNTMLNLSWFYSTYLVGGEFEDLGIKGDVTNYNVGITQPIFKTFKHSLTVSTKYTKKTLDNYILDEVTSKEIINEYDFSLNYSVNFLYAVNTINIGTIFGSLEDNAVKTRVGGSDRFIKYHAKLSRNQFINKTNNLIFTLNGQYSNERLPTTEMYSIGGAIVKGFEPSAGMGDSGYSTSLEWMNKLFNMKYLSCSLGVFINYGEVFKNNVMMGEYKKESLLGYGVKTIFSVKNRYFLNISMGYPIDSDNIVYRRKAQIYATLNLMLW